jgi:type I restriction enzyme S subunit
MRPRVSWPIVPLSTIAEFRNGVNYNQSNFGIGIKVIGVSDFQDHVRASFDQLEEINPDGVVRKEHLLRDGDILFVRSNGNRELIGRSLFVNGLREDVTHSAFSIRLRFTSSQCYPRFYAYLFRSSLIRQALSMFGSGTNISNLNQGILQQLKVPLPAIPIQERIASILSAYDDLIENNTHRIRILENMAQMLYREWFVNFRFPGHEKVRMVESESGPIPQSWAVTPLETMCQRITDGSHWSPPNIDSTYRMASSKDMHRWGLDLSTARTIAKEDFEALVRNDCKPLAGDVLITKDGANYLKYCFVVEKDIDAVLLSSVAMVRPNPTKLSSHYLSFHLGDPSVKTRLAGRVSGAAIPRIVLKDFRQFGVLIPPIAVQMAFERLVEPIVGLCWRLTDKNDNLRTTRDFLLPKLISGEIPVEAAAELEAIA